MHRIPPLSRRTLWKFFFTLFCTGCLPAAESLVNNSFSWFTTKPKRSTNSSSNKQAFLDALDTVQGINAATPKRTALVQVLLPENPTSSPGAQLSFQPIAPGTWVVVYAPHITTMARVLGNSRFDPILYEMRSDGTMTSHVRWTVPQLGSCWLSVSGTYASLNDQVCQVDFDQVWVKWNAVHAEDDRPYPTLQSVPSSFYKHIIQTVGKWGFVEGVSVFPVVYLADDFIVFDFQLLGTRICAKKMQRNRDR